MISLNRIEQRSLAIATALVVAGTGLRLGLGPGPEDTAWQPTAGGRSTIDDAAALRTAVEAGVEREKRAAEPLAPGERIDPNFADETELRRLPGIGPAKAAAIVDDRRARGPFRDLSDLQRVPGIGPTTLTRLAPSLHLAPGSPPPGVPRATDRDRLDLNRATVEELAALPGIGPELASRIAAFRVEIGGFRSPDQLLEVRGIGPGTLEKIRTRVRIR